MDCKRIGVIKMDQETRNRIEELTNELVTIGEKIIINDDIHHLDIAIRNLREMLRAIS